MRKVCYPLLACALATMGCATNTSTHSEGLKKIHSINLIDKTDPVLLAGTSAGKVREFLELGLNSRGYSVCSDCSADADAILTVEEFKSGEKFGFPARGYRHSSTSVWYLRLEKDGAVLFDESEKDENDSAIDELAARQVQDMLDLLQDK